MHCRLVSRARTPSNLRPFYVAYLLPASLERSTSVNIRQKITELEMWVNAQRDGRPADYIGGALCSTPQFG